MVLGGFVGGFGWFWVVLDGFGWFRVLVTTGNQARTPLVHCARPLPHPNLDTTLTQYLDN